MSWAKFDDGWWSHEKILAVGNAGAGAHARAIDYCCQHLTDGKLPTGALVLIHGSPTAKSIDELLQAKLYDRHEDGSIWVHDFLDYNPSRESVLAKRAADRDRKRRPRGAQPPAPSLSGEEPSNPLPSGFQPESEQTPSDLPDGIQPESVGKPGRDGTGRDPEAQRGVQGGEFRHLARHTGDRPPPRLKSHQLVDFEALWQAYPNHEDRAGAEEAYARLDPDEDLRKRILRDVQRRAASQQWQREGGRYVTHLKTYLRNARWCDEVSPDVAPIEPGSAEAAMLERLARRRGTRGAA